MAQTWIQGADGETQYLVEIAPLDTRSGGWKVADEEPPEMPGTPPGHPTRQENTE